MTRHTAAFHWSGGKDSALALSRLLADEQVRVDRLVTTVHAQSETSTVHGIPVDLLRAQAESIGLPLQTIPLPGPGLDGYGAAVADASASMRNEGVDAVAFGDLHASGVLELKQEQFGPLGLAVLTPLWDQTSRECIEAFLDSGIRAVTVVVDAAVLRAEDVGVPLDRDFVARLPGGADPCGELGEFHTFAHDGPLFAAPVPFDLAERRRLTRRIRTTDGLRTYSYWLATPILARGGATVCRDT